MLILKFAVLLDYTDKFRKDEICLQLKMKKHYIKPWIKKSHMFMFCLDSKYEPDSWDDGAFCNQGP